MLLSNFVKANDKPMVMDDRAIVCNYIEANQNVKATLANHILTNDFRPLIKVNNDQTICDTYFSKALKFTN